MNTIDSTNRNDYMCTKIYQVELYETVSGKYRQTCGFLDCLFWNSMELTSMACVDLFSATGFSWFILESLGKEATLSFILAYRVGV